MDSVGASVGASKLKNEWNELNSWGQHDAGWLSFYDYFRNVCKLEKETEKLLPLINLAKETGWHLFYKDIAILSEKPIEVCRNDIGQLHNFYGPAIKWNDGYELYRFNGIRIDKKEHYATLKPDDFTKEIFSKEENADIRRELIRKVGNERLLNILDYKVIDSFEEYKLISFDIGDGRIRPHLKMICPSTKLIHILGTRPENDTCKKALAFLFQQNEWKRPIKEDSIVNEYSIDSYSDNDVVLRHGDVNFKKYSGPTNEIKNLTEKGIIHEGNNNNHEFISGLFEIQNINDKKICIVLDDSIIGHNEHGNLTVPPGTYEISIALEFDHWKEEARKVID